MHVNDNLEVKTKSDDENGSQQFIKIDDHTKANEAEVLLSSKDEGYNQVSPDDIFRDLGGCGLFQVLLVLIVHSMKLSVCWSLLGNSFFAYTPRWRCSEDVHVTIQNTTRFEDEANLTLYVNGSMSVPVTEDLWNERCTTLSGKTCTVFEFEKGARTWATEFDLVCGMSWVPATIMSLQMAGMCLGSLISGQLADLLGRKTTLFMSMLFLIVFHTISCFPVHWIQIAVARVFIGIGCAFYLSIYHAIMAEFTASKWRPVVSSVPSWSIEGTLFALGAYLLQDWKKLTITIVIQALITLAAWLYVPESLRWYLTHDKYAQADALIKRIAKWNKIQRLDPDITKKAMVLTKSADSKVKKYSVLILIRKIALLKITAPLAVSWLAIGIISYGIYFGVQKLSGNIYMNIFLFAIASSPVKFIAMFLQNRFGRKIACFVAFSVCFVGGLVVGIIQYIDTPYRKSLTNYCALAAMVGVDGTWGPVQTFTIELYPTVVRSTGFGFVSIFARVGAVIGPQFVYLSDFVPGLLYFVVAAIALSSIISLATLPETRKTLMIDRLEELYIGRKEEKENTMI